MTIEQNKKIAQRLVEGLGTNGDTGAFELLDEGAVWTIMADCESFPVTGPMAKREFVDHINRFHGAMPNGIQVTVTGLTAEGGRVAVEAKSIAVLANGNTLRQVYHFLFEIVEGRIVAVREYIDTAHAMAVFRG